MSYDPILLSGLKFIIRTLTTFTNLYWKISQQCLYWESKNESRIVIKYKLNSFSQLEMDRDIDLKFSKLLKTRVLWFHMF